MGATVMDMLDSNELVRRGHQLERNPYTTSPHDFTLDISYPVVLGDKLSLLNGWNNLTGSTLSNIEPDCLWIN
jgi:hypothetical protein